MTLICRSTLALALSSSLAMGQIITPRAQGRHVTASVDVTGDGTDSDTENAPDFGPFAAQVSVNSPGSGMSGASQDSQIRPGSFMATCTQSSSGTAGSESIASFDFDVTTTVHWEVSADYNSSDGGFFSYSLTGAAGQYIGGWFGIAEGPQNIVHTGQLDPGSYSISFQVSGGGGYSFATVDALLQLTLLSGSYCVAAANSAGPGAHLAAGGSQIIADHDFRLEATGVTPNVFGLVFYGPNQIQTPFGDGFRCVGGQVYRVQPPVQADANGILTKPISFTSGPASSGSGMIQPLSTWNFQLWYRDPLGPGGTGYNTSDAIWATF